MAHDPQRSIVPGFPEKPTSRAAVIRCHLQFAETTDVETGRGMGVKTKELLFHGVL
jgi:hypothetical protein